MAFVIRRLRRMDLTFFHAHGATAKGKQRAINIDGWLIPMIGPPPANVNIRYRDVDDASIRTRPQKFGRLQKNYRLHGRMVPGAGFARYKQDDLMLMRFVGDTITWAILQDVDDSGLFAFLQNQKNAMWRGNTALLTDGHRIRRLEHLLGRYDPELFFAEEVEGLDEEPASAAVRRALRRALSPESFAQLQRTWERNGLLGEQFAMQRERSRLEAAGRPDLARRVSHVSQVDATAPFDILSFEGMPPSPEAERFIEVKSTSGTGIEFEMSEAEWQFAEDKRHQHVICRVTRVNSQSPGCQDIRDIVGIFLSDRGVRRPIVFKVRIS